MSISGDAVYLEKEYREETDISERIISEAGCFFSFLPYSWENEKDLSF